MAKTAFVPDRGDVVWLNFHPQEGHEQAGRRPGLVISPRLYHERSGLIIVCPITSKAKGYPFEVPIPDGHPVAGVVLADQVKSFDFRARDAEFWCHPGGEVVGEVVDRLGLLLHPE